MLKFPITVPKQQEINISWKNKHYPDTIQFYPTKLVEEYIFSDEKWKNKLYYGNNIKVLGHLLKYCRNKIDLVYIDPPFNTDELQQKN